MSPLEKIDTHPGSSRGISLFIKRDDLLHPEIQGSKWRKLQPIVPMVKSGYPGGIVTFGGAFSNHLHAVAVAGKIFDFPTCGIVRGEHADLQNPTLLSCRENGMRLIPMAKKQYDERKTQAWAELDIEFPQSFFLPEGGNTREAVEACSAITKELEAQLPATQEGWPLFLCVPAGTGCTAAGIVAGISKPNTQALIFPVSHQGMSRDSIMRMVGEVVPADFPEPTFSLVGEYVFGGFAKLHEPVVDFTRRFLRSTGVLLDPVYTAKMAYGVFDMLEKGRFPEQSRVVLLHTGGLQGWAGFRERYGSAAEL